MNVETLLATIFGGVASTPVMAKYGSQLVALTRRATEVPDRRALPGALDDYLAFESAALRALMHIQLVGTVGTPPSLVGGLWSWPQVLRSWRRIVEELEEMLAAFGRLAVTGSSSENTAAVAVGLAIGGICSAWKPIRRQADQPEFAELVAQANDALSAFVSTVAAARRQPV